MSEETVNEIMDSLIPGVIEWDALGERCSDPGSIRPWQGPGVHGGIRARVLARGVQ